MKYRFRWKNKNFNDMGTLTFVTATVQSSTKKNSISAVISPILYMYTQETNFKGVDRELDIDCIQGMFLSLPH